MAKLLQRWFASKKVNASARIRNRPRQTPSLSVLVSWIALCSSTVGCGDSNDDGWKVESKPLDRQAQAFLDDLALEGARPWGSMTPTEGREVFAGLTDLFGHGPEDVEAEDRTLAGRIQARVYKPQATGVRDASLPAVVFFHGGGWVLGDLDTHDALCRRLAKQANCAVVSVNYRRAPEHRFPAALDDCYDATSFVAKNSSELGIDAKRLVVAGDSAGGNLAAGVAVRSRDEHGPAILAQVLIYPSLDAGCDSPSYAAYASGYGLTKADMQWFWRQYLEDEVGNALAVPSKLEDLRGLPPTFILTAEYDVLRDEAETFARQIRAAGGKVRLRRIGGTIHGFVHFAGKFDAGLQATSEIAQELASFFGATDP